MPAELSRRSALAAGGTLAGALAGCVGSSAKGRVRVAIFNSTPERRTVRVEIRREGETVWHQVVDVPPEGDTDDEDDGSVDTKYALTEVPEETRFNVRVALDGGLSTDSPLVMENVDSDPTKDVVVRIQGSGEDAWVDLST